MTYINDTSVRDFTFWLGAYEVWARLTEDELDELDILLDWLSELQPFESATEINDFVWFELLDYWDWTEEQQEEFWKRPYRWKSPF